MLNLIRYFNKVSFFIQCNVNLCALPLATSTQASAPSVNPRVYFRICIINNREGKAVWTATRIATQGNGYTLEIPGLCY
jgi:hypothetical protein